MKNLFRMNVGLISLLMIFTVLLAACNKDDDPSNPIPPTGTTIKTSITGRVTDTNGNIIPGVMVKLGNITTVSDNRGNFLFVNKDVPKTRMVLIATKQGYFQCIKAKKTQEGAANYINLVMEAYPSAATISGIAGGVVNIPGGASITFPVNAFVNQNGTAYTGQVIVYARHINPGADNFEAIVPGGDLSGVNTAGQTQSLYSLGMIEAKLFDNTGVNEIKIATGKTASLKFPIDPSQTSSALATIPMWHLDETTGLWQEEGQATKTGNFFTGNVSHFSTWNCDYSGPRTDIQGKVVDCQNNAMPGVTVTINGFSNVITDNTGTFTTWVPVGYVIDCQVLQIYNSFISANSPIQTITAIGGILNIIPTLVVPCATRISGTLKTCGGSSLSPGFVYASWNGGGGIYFTNDGTYKIYMEENTYVTITAHYSGFSGSTTVLSGLQGSEVIASPIQLCTAVVIAQNSFKVNTSGQGSTLYTMSNISSNTIYQDSNSDGIFETAQFTIQGTANPGNYDCSINISLSNRVNDYYPLTSPGVSNYIIIEMDSLWSYESGHPPFVTDNKLIFTDYGMPGGVTTGIYNFDTPTGSITDGSFSVIRTQ